MGYDSVTQNSVWQMTKHRGLHRHHQLARLEAQSGKAYNLVAVLRDEDLQKAARLGDRFCAQDLGHRQFRHSVFDTVPPRLLFISSDPRKLRIGEHAEGNETTVRGAISAVEVRMNDAVVVIADVSKLRAAGAIAHRPDVLSGGFQSIVDLDVAIGVELDSGALEADVLGVRFAAGSDQKVGAFDGPVAAGMIDKDSNAIARMSLDAPNFRVEQDLDSLVDEQFLKRRRDITVFTSRELRTLLNDSYSGAEAAKRLRQLKPYEAASKHDQMGG